MDPSNDEPSTGTFTTAAAGAPRPTPDGRPSIEARSPNTAPRLQKKRSNAGVRGASQPQSNAVDIDGPATARGVQKARKGSLRNAVRKLFGRRSREVEVPQASQVSPPRHGYHRSEPHTFLAPQPEVLNETAQENAYAYRTFSAPIQPLELVPSPAVQRTRSPYAVEFPRSARLKPLNLGDPYTAPGSQLRRRKTLPSILGPGSEATPASQGPASPDVPPVPGEDENEIGRAVSTDIKREKRRSRSAGDLRISQDLSIPARKRSDEIRFWRESFQGTVLRASGFTVPVHDDDDNDDADQEYRDDDHTPIPNKSDPFESRGLPIISGSSPPRGGNLDIPTSDFASPSALGSQISQDLEDRIAKLEAGLRSFRSDLAQMAADRNRRTVLIGGVPTPSLRRRASSGGRTASMLAETLQTDFGPSDYEYDYTKAARPSTSPQPPRTPPAKYKDPASGRALAAGERPPRARNDDPFVTATPSSPRQRPTIITSSAPRPPEPLLSNPPTQQLYQQPQPRQQEQQPQQHTFRSLYEMLADERSARRRLEIQMRGLREEIANLHYQVSNVSNFQSQRSSYYGGPSSAAPAGMDTTIGSSSRLHALLRETEAGEDGRSLPPTRDGPHSNRFRDSSGITIDPRVVSRFSGSESEAATGVGHEEDEATDLETPAEAYVTPTSGEGDFPFRNDRGGEREGRMF